jgi:hypothetical protein
MTLCLGHLLFMFYQLHKISKLYNRGLHKFPKIMLLQQHLYPTLPLDEVGGTFQYVLVSEIECSHTIVPGTHS